MLNAVSYSNQCEHALL